MIIMALDHTRDFFHLGTMSFRPNDLARTNAILFFTRWITHFCAPVFMFTAGLAAYYWLQKSGRTRSDLTKFLLLRGLLLIFFEVTVLRYGLFLDLLGPPLILTVLWALGWSMIILSVLIYLPIRVLTGLSIAVILLHNLADPIKQGGWLWTILHQPGAIPWHGIIIFPSYPLIPWFAVMAAGFCFGQVMSLEPAVRRKWIFSMGAAMTVAFFILRGLNVYGDPAPWTTEFEGMSAVSFFNTTKYPPSLSFLLMTLGPALLVLGWFEGVRFSSAANPLLLFGRTPLFYFLAHMYVLHALAFLLAWFRYGTVAFLWKPMPSMGGDPKTYPAGFGYELPAVYLIWLAVVVIMYPLCLWWSRRNSKGS
jgi:uncharacterized membrane protein